MKSEKVEKLKSRKGERTPYLISPLKGGRKRGGIFPYQLACPPLCLSAVPTAQAGFGRRVNLSTKREK